MMKRRGKRPSGKEKNKDIGIQLRMKPWVYDSEPPELKEFEEFIRNEEEKLKRDPMPRRMTNRQRAFKEAEEYLKYKKKREARLARHFNWGRCLYETLCCYKDKPASAYYIYQKWPTEEDYRKQEALNAAKEGKGADDGTKPCDVTVCICPEGGVEGQLAGTCDVNVCTCETDAQAEKQNICECPKKAGKSRSGTRNQGEGKPKVTDDSCVCSSSSVDMTDQGRKEKIPGKPGSQSLYSVYDVSKSGGRGSSRHLKTGGTIPARGMSGELNKPCDVSKCTCSREHPAAGLTEGAVVVDGVTCTCAVVQMPEPGETSPFPGEQTPPDYFNCRYGFNDYDQNEDDGRGESIFAPFYKDDSSCVCPTPSTGSGRSHGSRYLGDVRKGKKERRRTSVRYKEYDGENDIFEDNFPGPQGRPKPTGPTSFGDDPCVCPEPIDYDPCTCPNFPVRDDPFICPNAPANDNPRRRKRSTSRTCGDREIEMNTKKQRKKSNRSSTIHDKYFCPADSGDDKRRKRRQYSRLPSIIDDDECTCPSASRDEKSKILRPAATSRNQAENVCSSSPIESDTCTISTPTCGDGSSGPSVHSSIRSTTVCENIHPLQTGTSERPEDSNVCASPSVSATCDIGMPSMFSSNENENICRSLSSSLRSDARRPEDPNVCPGPPIASICDASSPFTSSSTESDNVCQSVRPPRTSDARRPEDPNVCPGPPIASICDASPPSTNSSPESDNVCQSVRPSPMSDVCRIEDTNVCPGPPITPTCNVGGSLSSTNSSTESDSVCPSIRPSPMSDACRLEEPNVCPGPPITSPCDTEASFPYTNTSTTRENICPSMESSLRSTAQRLSDPESCSCPPSMGDDSTSNSTPSRPTDSDLCSCSTGNEKKSKLSTHPTLGSDSIRQSMRSSRMSAAQSLEDPESCSCPPSTGDDNTLSSSPSSFERNNVHRSVQPLRTSTAQRPGNSGVCPAGNARESKPSRHTRGSGSIRQHIRPSQTGATCSTNTSGKRTFRSPKYSTCERDRSRNSVRTNQRSCPTTRDYTVLNACPPNSEYGGAHNPPARSTFRSEDGQSHLSQQLAEVNYYSYETYGEYVDDLSTTTNARQSRTTTIPLDRIAECICSTKPNERIGRNHRLSPVCRAEEERRDRSCSRRSRRERERRRLACFLARLDDVDESDDDDAGRDTPCQSQLPRKTADRNKNILRKERESKTSTRSPSIYSDARRNRKSSQRESESSPRRSRAASVRNDRTRERVNPSKYEAKRKSKR